jgi:hypothetical protein
MAMLLRACLPVGRVIFLTQNRDPAAQDSLFADAIYPSTKHGD